jgi:hypothetical protein
MSGKASAVLWIGLILVALNLISQWSTIKAVIFTGSGSKAPSGGGGITIPLDPFIPGLNIPLSQQTGQTTSIQAV